MDELYMKKFWNNVDIKSENECWPWKRSCDSDGYGMARRASIKQSTHAQIIAYELNSGDIVEKGMVIMHICDNPICCNPHHLKKVTQKENIWDAIRKGRRELFPNRLIGEKCYNAKLSENDVYAIKRMLKNGEPASEIAHRFCVSRGAITGIRDGKNWKSLTWIPPEKR